MKLIRYTLPTLILSALLIFPALSQAEVSLWDKARETSSKGWEASKKSAEEAAEWSKEKSTDAWDATKEGASDAAEWTRKKADKAWDAARKGTADALDALKGKEEKSAEKGRRDSRIF